MGAPSLLLSAGHGAASAKRCARVSEHIYEFGEWCARPGPASCQCRNAQSRVALNHGDGDADELCSRHRVGAELHRALSGRETIGAASR